MNASLAYCSNQFKKNLVCFSKEDPIYKSFEYLAQEISKLDALTQLHLYSSASQFLSALINEPDELVNSLSVFQLRCQSILNQKYDFSHKITCGLAVIAIAIAAVLTGAALGLGIGVLMGFWSAPLLFMTALTAGQTSAIAVSATSSILGVSIGAIVAFSLFKEKGIQKSLNKCVESIYESKLTPVVAGEALHKVEEVVDREVEQEEGAEVGLGNN